MVDLDPLDADDSVFLQQIILNHYAYTGSSVAKFVLDDFENQSRNFVKVFPKDFKKVWLSKKTEQVVNNNIHVNEAFAKKA